MARVKYRVSSVNISFMLAIAIIFDLLQFLLTLTVIGALLSWLVTAFAVCMFAIWFLILGVNYFSGRKAAAKMASVIGTAVIEFIPVINALPSITIGVLAIALVSRSEDRLAAR